MTISRFRIEYQTDWTLNIDEEKWNDPESSPDYPEMERMFSLFDKVLRREFQEVMPDDIYKNWLASNVAMIFGTGSQELLAIEEEAAKNYEAYKNKNK